MEEITFEKIADNLEKKREIGLKVDTKLAFDPTTGKTVSTQPVEMYGLEDGLTTKGDVQYYTFTSFYNTNGNKEGKKGHLVKQGDAMYIEIPNPVDPTSTGNYIDIENGSKMYILDDKKVGGGKMRKHCKKGSRRNPKTKRCRKSCKSGTRRNPRSHLCRKVRSKK